MHVLLLLLGLWLRWMLHLRLVLLNVLRRLRLQLLLLEYFQLFLLYLELFLLLMLLFLHLLLLVLQ